MIWEGYKTSIHTLTKVCIGRLYFVAQIKPSLFTEENILKPCQ